MSNWSDDQLQAMWTRCQDRARVEADRLGRPEDSQRLALREWAKLTTPPRGPSTLIEITVNGETVYEVPSVS